MCRSPGVPAIGGHTREAHAPNVTAQLSIVPAGGTDQTAILALAERLGPFGLATRPAQEIATRERRALADALEHPSPGSTLLVAKHQGLGVVGIVLLDTRRDYFTDDVHGHVAILAVAREAEGQGVGRALLRAAEDWGRDRGFRRLTLTVFADNRRAKELYARQGWRAELETHYKML